MSPNLQNYDDFGRTGLELASTDRIQSLPKFYTEHMLLFTDEKVKKEKSVRE